MNETGSSAIGELIIRLHIYYLPLIIVFGLLGNLLSAIVFLFSNLNQFSSSVYLSALSLADICFLLCLFLNWLLWIGTDLINYEVCCQLFAYISHVSSSLSFLFILAFTVERYVVVLLPLHKFVWCTIGRARKIIYILVALCLVLQMIHIFSSEVKVKNEYNETKRICEPKKSFRYHLNFFVLFDSIITFFLPFFVILVANFRICVRIWMTMRRRDEMTTIPASQRQELRITVLLVFVSVTFFVLNAPAHAFKLAAVVHTVRDTHSAYGPLTINLQSLSNLLYYTSHAVNFLLYSIGGNTFRQALLNYGRRLFQLQRHSSYAESNRQTLLTPNHGSRSSNRKNRQNMGSAI
ncbi:unnamed protein product [Dimorphilus gyrociliatus]|uniref:G-protein coupled receptors family 1 profile domain-containing protein n=1 Tax=Dimorphilus gyrociliatus TaxID=2664684 RepID=A0A7I8WB44_9ANNE|nr:unnamed protein product [Dimorphilus gyrociliatus]